MKKLLKEYGFNSDMQYMEMIFDSFINGQRSQALEQFKAMPKDSRKSMVKSIFMGHAGHWNTGLSSQQKELLFDNI